MWWPLVLQLAALPWWISERIEYSSKLGPVERPLLKRFPTCLRAVGEFWIFGLWDSVTVSYSVVFLSEKCEHSRYQQMASGIYQIIPVLWSLSWSTLIHSSISSDRTHPQETSSNLSSTEASQQCDRPTRNYSKRKAESPVCPSEVTTTPCPSWSAEHPQVEDSGSGRVGNGEMVQGTVLDSLCVFFGIPGFSNFMQICESCFWFWVLSWTSLTETWCRASTCWGLAFGAGEIKFVGQPFSTRTSDPKSTPFWYGLINVDYLSMSIKTNVPNLLVNQNLAVPTKPSPIFREIGGMYWNYIAIFHHIYHNYHIHISIHISIICVCIYIYT